MTETQGWFIPLHEQDALSRLLRDEVPEILDALTGICWNDDSQVVALTATKRLAEIDETAGVHIALDTKDHE